LWKRLFAKRFADLQTEIFMSQQMHRVEVLMSTYNAMKFGAAQLSSILAQAGVEVQLRVRDDGSTDGTQQWLDAEAAKGHLVWWQGENLKPARSFMELLEKADEEAGYYAFADQDDIWLSDKLHAAVARLEKSGDAPALYFSRTQPVNEQMEPLPALTFTPRVTFGEALMCHVATGHTMVMNASLRRVLLHYRPEFLPMHDMWVYLVALAVGAKVYYDEKPHVHYRQHSENVLGIRETACARWKRRWTEWREGKQEFSQLAEEVRKGFFEMMPDDERRVLTLFLDAKHRCLSRVRLLCAPEFRSGNRGRNLRFLLTVLTNSY